MSMICFCFQFTEEAIREDYKLNGKSTILEFIQKKRDSQSCRCAQLNPTGH